MHFFREHNLGCAEFKTLDCAYQELVPQLYVSVINTIKKTVTCNTNRTSHCTGACVITLQAKVSNLVLKEENSIFFLYSNRNPKSMKV